MVHGSSKRRIRRSGRRSRKGRGVRRRNSSGGKLQEQQDSNNGRCMALH
jgi:hypothetical protein